VKDAIAHNRPITEQCVYFYMTNNH